MPPIADSSTRTSPGVTMPSDTYVDGNPGDEGARAHVEEAALQQGAPEPGTGTVVTGKDKVPFKNQVFGYSKTLRGTVFRKPETKEQGNKILAGEVSPREFLDQKKAAKEQSESE